MAQSISKEGWFSGPKLEDGKLAHSSLVRLCNVAMVSLTFMLSTVKIQICYVLLLIRYKSNQDDMSFL